MGAPTSGMEAADQPTAESLLASLKTIDAAGKAEHAAVLGYWLSIRGEREFPPLHDLDPLELADAGPRSVLLELIGGGDDAEIRHLGQTLKTGETVERIADAPRPSILSVIAKKLSLVAIARNFLAFEDEFATAEGTSRCWLTLLPFSSAGAWVDYVYAFVTIETVPAAAEVASAAVEEPVEADETAVEETAPVEEQAAVEVVEPAEAVEAVEAAEVAQVADEPAPAQAKVAAAPGFSEPAAPAAMDGFYGTHVEVSPKFAPAPPKQKAAEPVAEAVAPPPPPEPEEAEPAPVPEPTVVEEPAPPVAAKSAPLAGRLSEVRAKADEARMAKLRSNAALYEGLSAAYDFALDAEDSPEDYLKLVEAAGLKINLRSPMRPVVKLAFDGMCDDAAIAQLEAVLAWAFDRELPRGSLTKQIEAEGGLAMILNGER